VGPVRRTLAAAATACLALAAPARATACPLLSDPPGDAFLAGPVPSPAVDVVSGDVASDATNVVAVLRVASLTGPDAVLRGQWFFEWRIAGVQHYVQLTRDAAGRYTSLHERDGVYWAPPAFAVDTATGTITWTMPRSEVPDLASPGATFDTLAAATIGPVGFADSATSTATYADGSPGCV
jgi:hypothetical protein